MSDERSPFASFLDHLEELRKRIFWAALALVVGAVVGYFFSDWLTALLTRPVPRLVFLTPAEAFVVKLKVALIAGLFIAAPAVFYQFWRFVKPALLPRETRYVTLAVIFCTFFFCLGVAFSYLVVLPVGLKFLLGFETAKLQPMLSIDRYITFISEFLLAFGLVFQIPVVIFFLTKLGVVTPRLLMKQQKVAIVIIFIVAAVLTPPDVISQLLMAGPLLVLYEISILGSFLAARTRN